MITDDSHRDNPMSPRRALDHSSSFSVRVCVCGCARSRVSQLLAAKRAEKRRNYAENHRLWTRPGPRRTLPHCRLLRGDWRTKRRGRRSRDNKKEKNGPRRKCQSLPLRPQPSAPKAEAILKITTAVSAAPRNSNHAS